MFRVKAEAKLPCKLEPHLHFNTVFFLLKALGYIHKLNITELQPEILRLQTCGNREAAGRAVTVDRMMTAHVALLAM